MFLGMPWLFKSLIRFNLLSKIIAHSTSCSSPNISHVTTTVIADFFFSTLEALDSSISHWTLHGEFQ